MRINVGGIDRIGRIVLGVIIVSLTAFNIIGLWGWLAIGLIVSGVFQFCPAYSILGVHTCKK
ncbi:MAG: DUF2892 domain-containing protein [Pseudomonadota bacterium]|jgi:hypothetical protein